MESLSAARYANLMKLLVTLISKYIPKICIARKESLLVYKIIKFSMLLKNSFAPATHYIPKNLEDLLISKNKKILGFSN